MTRRLTAHLFYSVNGVAESPNLWQFDAFGPEEGQMMGRAISGGTERRHRPEAVAGVVAVLAGR